MLQKRGIALFVSVVGLSVLAAHALQGISAGAASPYKVVPGWGKLTAPLKWGEVPNVAIDPKGTVFVFTRTEPPVVELNAAGMVLKTWGQGMFVWPHGIRFDRDGNLWITDGRRGGRQRPDGLQAQLGRQQGTDDARDKGVSGDGPNEFNGVTDVAIAPNGDIFVSDGHVNSRIVKFTKDGKFIKTWGKKGTGPGEFNLPHSIAFDSRGRLLVADRSNKRIQLFDQDGKFLEEWKQFGEASGIFIMPDDTLYVTDWQDKKAIFIGSAKTARSRRRSKASRWRKALTVDKQGDIYAAEPCPARSATSSPVPPFGSW